MRTNLLKLAFIVIGFISLILGVIGILIPILPTTPFLLLSSVCFLKGSSKLDLWFRNTKIYKKNVDPFLKNKTLTINTKISIICSLTLIFSIGFYFTKNLLLVRIILVLIWFIHILYFTLFIKSTK